jgi:hypothetical protein
MADTSKFKTAHQLARDLLAGPDLIVVLPTPMFDMPGCFSAFPVRAETIKVEETEAVAIMPDHAALQSNASETSKPSAPVADPQSPPAG